jgi:hypothetical protein
MVSPTMFTVRVPRLINDQDYGREEYIEYCVQRILQGEEIYISSGGSISPKSLPPILREKSNGFFSGFRGALTEVVEAVKEVGKKVVVRPLLNGSNSDALDLPDSGPDGYFVSLEGEKNTAKIA